MLHKDMSIRPEVIGKLQILARHNYVLCMMYIKIDILNKTGTAVNKVKSLLKSWQAFAGFHTEAASSGHYGNVRLTKIINKTYQDGTVVDLL